MIVVHEQERHDEIFFVVEVTAQPAAKSARRIAETQGRELGRRRFRRLRGGIELAQCSERASDVAV